MTTLCTNVHERGNVFNVSFSLVCGPPSSVSNSLPEVIATVDQLKHTLTLNRKVSENSPSFLDVSKKDAAIFVLQISRETSKLCYKSLLVSSKP